MKIKPNYKVRDVAGEKMVVMQGKDGVDLTKVIMLNSTGERLWSSLQGKEFTVDDAAEMLMESYGIGKQQAVKDAESWIDSLVKVGLIEK
ncbi:MAG: PqqD family protein [Marinilabiliales bacterium]|nr:MAG: PqqD family protein [Marinilabiliales bacterium]